MGILSDLFGGDKDHHDDGSTTTRYSDGTSVTKDSDGHTVEYTRRETDLPFGLGNNYTVTRNGDREVINVQRGSSGGKK